MINYNKKHCKNVLKYLKKHKWLEMAKTTKKIIKFIENTKQTNDKTCSSKNKILDLFTKHFWISLVNILLYLFACLLIYV